MMNKGNNYVTKIAPHNGKAYVRLHGALDLNGNKILKIFYADGSTEILRGSWVYSFPNSVDKFYKSLSGLRNSKIR